VSSLDARSFPAIVCAVDDLEVREVEGAGALVCLGGHRYQIRLGIPRLSAAQSSHADAFCEQWHQYRTTQLDPYSETTISKDRLRRCLGEGLWYQLQQTSRLEVLETGCGAGRFTEILLQLPAAYVTSTDLSSAVEPNQVNCPQSGRHRIVQCDINPLAFLPEQYDIRVCLGVIEHTKNPEKTITDLYRQVKPGGWLVIDHYAH
jgi:2-polyprenyl-3-methyl-5-hydroxy-6-metoxy-1,4-benzoquinol methylase